MGKGGSRPPHLVDEEGPALGVARVGLRARSEQAAEELRRRILGDAMQQAAARAEARLVAQELQQRRVGALHCLPRQSLARRLDLRAHKGQRMQPRT